MATVLRNTDPVVSVLATATNDLKVFLMAQLRLAQADLAAVAADAQVLVTTTFIDPGYHNDKSEVVVTSADAAGTDGEKLALSIALCNELTAVYTFHMADTHAHKVTGVALAAVTKVTSEAGAYTRANDIKSKYGTHRASTTYHYVADGTNTIAAADATTLASLVTLVNELKNDINLHMAGGPSCKSIRLVDA